VAGAGIIAVLVMLLLLSVDAAHLLAAAARAETAADAAALGAAQELAFSTGSTPEAQAQRFAAANGAELVSCACAQGSTEAVVTVRVVAGGMLALPDGRVIERTARGVVDLPTG
jgi:Flp pilus assembly protein TadG